MQELFQKTVDFIRELYHQPEGFIPLHAPVFQGNEKKYLNECIDSTFVSSVGKFVDQFEEKIAEYTGAKKAIVCVNGTIALHLALMLVGVERDIEVITRPLTFIATVNAITYCGVHPVFLDVDLDTLGLSPKALANFLEIKSEMRHDGCYNKTTHRQIGAVVPMHTFGHPNRIDEIVEICTRYHIPVVEDAAESMGSFYMGQHTGTFGKIGVLSFNGNKILTTGGGGMFLFQDEILAKRAKHLTTQAKVPHPWAFAHDEVGYNYRLPNINAALGLAHLEQLNTFLQIKREIADAYSQFFKGTDFEFIKEPDPARSNYWLNCILFRDKEERESFLKYSNENGVMSRPAWELMNRLSMFSTAQCGDLTNAEWISDRLVNIPSSVII
jgi:perosamine synthetase